MKKFVVFAIAVAMALLASAAAPVVSPGHTAEAGIMFCGHCD